MVKPQLSSLWYRSHLAGKPKLIMILACEATKIIGQKYFKMPKVLGIVVESLDFKKTGKKTVRPSKMRERIF